MRRLTESVLLGTVVLLLGGCAKEPPKCSDEATLSLVKKIILDKILNGENVTDSERNGSLKIELPRASAYDEKVKKLSCDAKLIAGDLYQAPIAYESQLDDKNEHVVVVNGISQGDMLGIQTGVVEAIKAARAGKSGTGTAQQSAPGQTSPTSTPPASGDVQPPASAPANDQSACVADRMRDWEVEYKNRVDAAMEEAMAKGEQVHTSAGAEELARTEALDNAKAACR